MTPLPAFVCNVVTQIVNPMIMLLAAGAFVIFLWGIARFVMTMSSGGEAATGKRAMFWGIVGLVIIFSAYGIINIGLSTFNLGSYHGSGCSTAQVAPGA